ncbi:hypothetical protein CFAM422_010258 [Trichoderma lentiforme]|uniref:Uncharacterized protein n=1 Tax=Trichoderma lentiforme TaxID=1567552 RepID=A0A9P4X7U7_9HYPO|nr:hypothetical protein CFAM422_010258 [Trichoderma lentiforme]
MEIGNLRHRHRLPRRRQAAGQNKLIVSQRMLGPESAPPLLVRDEAMTRGQAKQLARDSNAAEGASNMELEWRASAVVIGRTTAARDR